MSDDLSIRGELTDSTVPDLLRSIARSGESGILTLDDGAQTTSIYLDGGRIVAATSSDPDLSLHHLLLRDGEIDLQQYHAIPETATVSGRIGAVMSELGLIESDGLIRALERQLREIVQSTLHLRLGSYVVEFVDSLPSHVMSLRVSTDSLLIEGIRRIDRWSLVSRGVGRLDRTLRQTDGAAVRTYNVELTPDEIHVFEMLTTPQTIDTICARSYLSNFVTCRIVWGLLTIGLVEDAIGEPADRHTAEAAEYELEGRVERYNTLYQTIFGIVFQKIGDHTYDFTDRVVAQLSPHIVPYLSGMTFVNEGRLDYDQLLNNVISSGSADQTYIIDEVLNELLYAWILEIKREFGSELESEIVQLARAVKDL